MGDSSGAHGRQRQAQFQLRGKSKPFRWRALLPTNTSNQSKRLQQVCLWHRVGASIQPFLPKYAALNPHHAANMQMSQQWIIVPAPPLQCVLHQPPTMFATTYISCVHHLTSMRAPLFTLTCTTLHPCVHTFHPYANTHILSICIRHHPPVELTSMHSTPCFCHAGSRTLPLIPAFISSWQGTSNPTLDLQAPPQSYAEVAVKQYGLTRMVR